MRFQKQIQLLLTITAVVLAFPGCKKPESPDAPPLVVSNYNNRPVNNYNPPSVTFTATINGFAVDEQGKAIRNAKITAGNKTTTTDENGAYTLTGAPFTGDFCYIKAEKGGYFTGSVTITGKSKNTFQAKLTLQRQVVQSYNSAKPAKIKLANNAAVDFPENAVVTSSGVSYTGQVHVSLAHINPEAPNFRELIPGGDLRAFDANNQDMQLYSYGMLNVELHDDNGNLLQLAKGKTATLTFPVPASLLSTAPAAIPLWYFDEIKGVWIEEGTATLNGNMYTGAVSHFTPWNVDKPVPPASLAGKVTNADGEPIPYATLSLDQALIQANEDGTFTSRVVSGQAIDVDLYNPHSKSEIELNKTVKALAANEEFDMGQITMPNMVKLTATLKNCDGSPFSGYAFLKHDNVQIKMFVTSELNLFLPQTSSSITLELYSRDHKWEHKQPVTLSTASITNLGNISVCNPITLGITKINFTYNDGSGPQDISYSYQRMSAKYQFSNSSNKATIIITDTDNNDFYFEFVVDKKGAGTFALQQYTTLPRAVFEISEGVKQTFFSTAMTLSITDFGEPGQVVKGTFSGTASKNSRNVTITNGEFTVIRSPDIP